MKKAVNRISFGLRILFLILLLIIFPLSYRAQASEGESTEKKETGKKDNDLKLKLFAETGVEYTDNVYRLTESQISGMEAIGTNDTAGGHYKNMDSVSDYIVEPVVGIKVNSESPLGGKFGLTSWIRYNYYFENQKSSFPEGRIRLRNSIGENGALTLEGNFLYGYFKKNYLSGVNDINGNGNIPIDERIYSSAIYDEYEGIIAYEHKIINEKKNTISGLDIQPFTGYRVRIYNSTFSNRDQDIAFLGLGLNLEFFSRIGLEMIYKCEGVSSPGNSELILFDETVSGTDVNGDGEIKRNAPLVTPVDRSSMRDTIEINPYFELTKDAWFFMGYERRRTEYTSDNPLDIDHYNQTDYRQQIKTGIRYDFSKAWSAEAEYNRTDEEEEEDGDYSQNNFLLNIKCDFK